MRVCEPLSGAVVLGSTQPDTDLDPARLAARGLDVVRRRSGGGAVLVEPGSGLWVDAYLPRDDPLFADDVSGSSRWLGECWAAAVRAASPETPSPSVLARNPAASPPEARSLCFAGAVAGEVFAGEHKVVGISQRRDRHGAWFHSMALLEFDAGSLTELFAWPEERRRRAAAELGRRATALAGGRRIAGPLESELLGQLLAL